MEVETLTASITFHGGNNKDTTNKEEEEDSNVPLPGFRFHPTDEELVGFYLRRKVENKKISLELIKSAEIYKHDPWDLPKLYDSIGDKEWYFYCRRGRKYKNSVRPNRVTSSGFWKATGVDKNVYSSEGGDHRIIGLKKSLVYYRGNCGKGTKTDWTMHEFRLPPSFCNNSNGKNPMIYARNIINADDQEAEVWTLCRVFKRSKTASAQYKKSIITANGSKIRSSNVPYGDEGDDDGQHINYISFGAGFGPMMNASMRHAEEKTLNDMHYAKCFVVPENSNSSSSAITSSALDHHLPDMLSHGTEYNWEYLRSLASICDMGFC